MATIESNGSIDYKSTDGNRRYALPNQANIEPTALLAGALIMTASSPAATNTVNFSGLDSDEPKMLWIKTDNVVQVEFGTTPAGGGYDLTQGIHLAANFGLVCAIPADITKMAFTAATTDTDISLEYAIFDWPV